jgi:hypothetical protein
LAARLALRVADLLRADATASEPHGLVDATELARTLRVDRSYVYAHAEELGAVRLGGGSKPRLRFDLEASLEAFTCYVSKQSQDATARTEAESAVRPAQRRRRLPNGLPEPGSVLAVRPRERT